MDTSTMHHLQLCEDADEKDKQMPNDDPHDDWSDLPIPK
jgi:hypothetical protein